MKDYNVKIKVRNNYLLERMREYGINTNSELARAAGITPSQAGEFMNLKVSPFNNKGELKPAAQKICDVLCTFVEDIFPPQHLHNPLKTNAGEVELSICEVSRLLTPETEPDKIAEIGEAVDMITKLVGSLTQRQQKVINQRFGFEGEVPKTCAEIGREMGITKERVKQIEHKALRELRHPVRSGELRQFLGDTM